MNCLKCGREVEEGQVFCEECRQEMERYPVRPGTVVLLPKRRSASAPRKAPRRRTLPLEDQVRLLKKRVRLLTALLIAVTALALALIYPAVQNFIEDHPAPGQNYSSVTPANPSPAPEAP